MDDLILYFNQSQENQIVFGMIVSLYLSGISYLQCKKVLLNLEIVTWMYLIVFWLMIPFTIILLFCILEAKFLLPTMVVWYTGNLFLIYFVTKIKKEKTL